eukprot:GFKZ01012585.1.p1 GENE.GFKZ01012585.1~~GFKZ01012585.1.p1  ORF type:complete len:436 (-),score=78.48 GFKZ01012585.1:1494-2801(-)
MSPAPPTTTPNLPNTTAGVAIPSDLTGCLEWYYAHIFPLAPFIRWLRYGSDDNLSKREISFTLQGDIYLRWKSFPTSEQFHDALKQLKPVKIDIGAIYSYPPADKNTISATITPLEKELVFDIDMTDYADVMSDLASGTAVQVCDNNWTYMATAVKVLDAALREDFAFENILWVYSGRRGIHCWVADHRARRMTNEQRSAVADYLHIRFEGRENAGKRQTEVTIPLHPSLSRAKRIACERTFRNFVLEDQGMLNNDQRVRDMAAMIPNRTAAETITAKLTKATGISGVEKWERMEKEIAKMGRKDHAVRAAADYIMLKHTYPRLDVNVSKEINHLLKAPFCVHPKTGRVCVPFRAEDVDDFLPGMHAPEIGQLLKEMKKVNGEVTFSGVASEKLNKAVKVFEEFVSQVEVEVRKEARLEKLDELDKKQIRNLMTD